MGHCSPAGEVQSDPGTGAVAQRLGSMSGGKEGWAAGGASPSLLRIDSRGFPGS